MRSSSSVRYRIVCMSSAIAAGRPPFTIPESVKSPCCVLADISYGVIYAVYILQSEFMDSHVQFLEDVDDYEHLQTPLQR